MPNVASSMKALVENKGKYLFLKQVTNKRVIWDLPGGHIEYGEDPLDTLKREVKEETFLEIKILKSLGVWHVILPENLEQIICHTYLCHPVGEPKIDLTRNPADEHFVGYYWLTINEALEIPEITQTKSFCKLLESL